MSTTTPNNKFAVSTLTSDHLCGLLTELERAPEAEGRAAFLLCAKFLQDAGAALPPPAFSAILDKASVEHGDALLRALDFSIDFHQCTNGDRLGLWLWPVAVAHGAPLGEVLPLTKKDGSLAALAEAVASAMARQNGRNEAQAALTWALPVPALLSAQALSGAGIHELMRVAPDAREALREGRALAGMRITCTPEDMPPGTDMMFLPIVVRHPAGCYAQEMTAEPTVARLVEDTVSKTLATASGIRLEAMDFALPFSLAILRGEMPRVYSHVRAAVEQCCQELHVAPGALHAFLALYDAQTPVREEETQDQSTAASSDDEGPDGSGLYLGVTAISRLNGALLMSASMPVAPEIAEGIMEAARDALVDSGLMSIEQASETLKTVWCRDCEGPHLAVPTNDEVFAQTSSARH
jgi:hypothetical protein